MRIRVWRSDVCASDLEVAEPVDHRRQLQMTIGCEGETRARPRLTLCLAAPFGEARRGRRVEKEGRAEQRRDLFLDLNLHRVHAVLHQAAAPHHALEHPEIFTDRHFPWVSR